MVRNVLLLAIGMYTCCAHGQDEPHAASPLPSTQDSIHIPRNTAGITVDRNLNTFTWSALAFLDTSLAGVRTSAREQYSTTIIQLDSDPTRKVLNNQQQASFSLTEPLGNGVAAVGRWNSFVFTDSRDIGLNKASMHTLLGGLELSPASFLTVTPLAGYRWDTQSDFHDHGPAYQIGAELRPYDLDGYVLNMSGQYHEDLLNPRRLESHFFLAGIERQFSPNAIDSVVVGLYRQRREFYSADSSIESRRENVFTVANTLAYQVEQSIQTVLYFGIGSRILDKVLQYAPGTRPVGTYDTYVDEFQLDTYIEGRWRSPRGRADASLRFGYSERNELHGILSSPEETTGPLLTERALQEDSKNNLGRRTMVAGSLHFPVSGSDEVFLATSASLLRYDTPSELNREDRDELLVVTSIGTRHHLSSVMDIGVTLEGTLSHLVYLLSDRSGSNNINRVLRLSPTVLYRPRPWFVSLNSFEVLASYTVYDFEVPQTLVQSYSYRQFGWSDSSSLDFTRKVGVDLSGSLKLYERGQLNWSDFRERTENSYVDRNVAIQLRFSPNRDVFFAFGIRHFSQTRYRYDDVIGKTLDAYYRSIGPTCSIVWSPGSHSQIALHGWYENRLQSDGSLRGLATMTLMLHLML